MAAMTPNPTPSLARRLAAGYGNLSWKYVTLLFALNAAIALSLWIEDPRPYWHPFITAQCFGFVIAYCVRTAAPWDHQASYRRIVAAVAVGSVLGMTVAAIIKRYTIDSGYTLDYVIAHRKGFMLTTLTGFVLGLIASVIVLMRIRGTRAAVALHKAEAERLLMSKHAMESELKLMQAQIEPHFLFNTLASVQFLTETDPPQASRLLGHLLSYLRAALPQMRTASTTLGQEVEFAEAYLNILRMRMGARLDFSIDVPGALRTLPFPPVLLISIVENAVTHGLEPQADGGHVAIAAKREANRLIVTVSDTGAGLSGPSQPGQGVGVSNVRDRLAALFAGRARFTLEEAAPHGARATIEIPIESPIEVADTAVAAA
ncbi:MAG: histidine kinase [Betaproteobacteria bacterium]